VAIYNVIISLSKTNLAQITLAFKRKESLKKALSSNLNLKLIQVGSKHYFTYLMIQPCHAQ